MNQTGTARSRLESQLIVVAFSEVRTIALGIAVGIVTGALLAGATAWLLVSAGPAPEGTPIGPHLSLLGQFLPAYEVTWPGVALGLLYGALIGFSGGAVLGWLLNFSHRVYVQRIRRGLQSGVMQDAI